MPQRLRNMTGRAVPCRSVELDPVLAPAAVDERAHLVRHPDLLRPRPGALRRALRRRVDPELATLELEGRRVVEVIERSLGDEDVALRVDVRPDVEEDLRVVVDVDPLVDDDHGL